MTETAIFFASLIMNMFGLYVSVWLWNHIWVKPGYDCNIPRAYFLYDLHLELTNDREMQYRASNIKDIFKAFKVIIQKFDADYYIRNCGFDAYAYLVIQRRFLIGMVQLGGFGIQGLDWLKLRSIHIKGVPPSDLGGKGLKKKIMEYLKQNGNKGEIISMNVIPAYGRIMQLEQKKMGLDINREILMGMKDDMNILTKLLLKNYLDDDYYLKKIEEINEQIEQETQNNLEGSGHAFVCFSSLSSLNLILRMFKDRSTNELKLAYNTFLNAIKNKKPKKRVQYSNQHEQHINNYEDDVVLIGKTVPDPLDIQWLNMEGEGKGYSQLTRWCINLFLFLIIMFISTPSAILYMIEEEYPRKSKYQVVILQKCLFYMILNVLIIPSFAAESKLPIYKLITSSYRDSQMERKQQADFEKMFQYHYGLLYATIIQQSAVISVLCYLNRLGYIFTNYVSPFLVHYTGVFYNENKNHYKNEDEGFLYGYASAYMLLIILIGFVFFFSTPWILVSVVIYLAIRHALDCYILLIVHKQEQESSGNFAKCLLVYSIYCCVIFQVIMDIYFYVEGENYNLLISMIVTVATLIIGTIINRPLLNIEDLEEVSLDHYKLKYMKEKESKKWVNYYRHPLIIPSIHEEIELGDNSINLQQSDFQRADSINSDQSFNYYSENNLIYTEQQKEMDKKLNLNKNFSLSFGDSNTAETQFKNQNSLNLQYESLTPINRYYKTGFNSPSNMQNKIKSQNSFDESYKRGLSPQKEKQFKQLQKRNNDRIIECSEEKEEDRKFNNIQNQIYSFKAE